MPWVEPSQLFGSCNQWLHQTIKEIRLPRSGLRVIVCNKARSQAVAGVSVLACLLSTQALANPNGATVIQGQATLSTPAANQLLVTTQNGAGLNHSAINWQNFSIAAGESTHFKQPSNTSLVINRVLSDTPSAIFGTLSSNGRLVLVNQAGIAVGQGAVVDTAGFTASVLGMSDADAINGRLRFGTTTLSQFSTGTLQVAGQLIARSGDVVLIAPSVEAAQSAVVEAPNGSVVLAAGQQVEITGRGLEGITMQVQAPSDQAINLGRLTGDAVGIFAGTLKHSGDIDARGLSLQGGKIVLKAGGDAVVDGNATLRALKADQTGGQIEVLGEHIAIRDQSSIDASGPLGGGRVLVGGDWQGSNGVKQATTVSMAEGARIQASATQQGNGGTIVLWSDVRNAQSVTSVAGSLYALGGEYGGNGGMIETSGAQLKLPNSIRVSTRAPKGKVGMWLLDPVDITVGPNEGDTVSGALIAEALFNNDVTLNTADAGELCLFGSCQPISEGSGAAPGDIFINDIIDASQRDGALTLLADGNIQVNQSIILGTGSLTLTARAGSITQDTQNGWVTVQALNIQSALGAVLNNSSNQVSSFSASNSGSGNIELISSGPLIPQTEQIGPLSLQNVNNTNGNIRVVVTGGVTSSGAVVARNGSVSITANSPLTIGSGGVSASGNIDLIATNQTSTGNMVLNGPITTSSGTLSIDAAANLTQNSSISAPQGSVRAGGTISFGPNAIGDARVSYQDGSLSTVTPPATSIGGVVLDPLTLNDISGNTTVASYAEEFTTLSEDSGSSADTSATGGQSTGESTAEGDKENEGAQSVGLVIEVQICRR